MPKVRTPDPASSLEGNASSLAASYAGRYHASRPLSFHGWEGLEGRMRVRDRVRDCVVFVGRMDHGKLVPYGTGFVALFDEGDFRFQYLVTAKHVLELINSEVIYVRANLKAGGAEVSPVPLTDWRFHPWPGARRTVDVAIVQVSMDLGYYDIAHVTLDDAIATDEIVQEHDIGIGDEVAITGLFTLHWGAARNAPIVRCGNIARMIEEPIYTPSGYMDAYLIEAKSIGGLSGSPVFVNMPPYRIAENAEGKGFIAQTSGDAYYLLGLVQGHFVIDNTEDALTDRRVGEINAGIAVVIPVQKIIETVNHPDLQRHRADAAENMRRETGLVRDAAAVVAQEAGDDDWLDSAEAARRRDATLRNMLNTPPKPQSAIKGTRKRRG